MADEELEKIAETNDVHGNSRARQGRKRGSGNAPIRSKLSRIFSGLRTSETRKRKKRALTSQTCGEAAEKKSTQR